MRLVERETPALSITLFGRMCVTNANGESALPRSRKTRAVLAILALSPDHTALRSRITGLLWSLREKEQARASLRQAVHELQGALGPRGATLLQADRNHLALADDGVWIDAAALARASPSQPERLSLFSGPLLEDLHGLDPAFDGWLADQSERLTRIARSLGEAIVAAQRSPADRQETAEQLLTIDRTHEAAWRTVIGVNLERGDHGAALAAYERCRSALAQTGAAVPSQETEALIEPIRWRPRAPQGEPWSPPRMHVRRLEQAQSVRLGIVPLRQAEPGPPDGLAWALMEEIATSLSQFRWIDCIVSATVGERLGDGGVVPPSDGLDFLLDGTLQRHGSRVRIIARLRDVRAGGSVVWTRRFDRDATDLFAAQDDIAAEAVAQIDAALVMWEAQRARCRGGGDPTAMDLLLRAIPALCRFEPQWFRKAGELLEAAVERDPGNTSAHAWLAHWHLFFVGQGWAPDPAAAVARAGDLAESAIRLDPGHARSLTLAGHVRGFLSRRPEEARTLHDRAIALNPNLALAWCFSGLVHSYLGDHSEAVRRIGHAQKLSPHDPQAFFFDTARIMPHLLSGEFEAAASFGRRATALSPGFTSALKGHLAALGHLGRDAEAADVRTRLLALEPGFGLRAAASRSAMTRDEDIALYVDGLRRAGVPE